MNVTGSSALYYAGIAVGLFYLFYLRMSSVAWDERERWQLSQEELHLGHLLKLIQAPDVRQLAADPRGRDSLLRGFSQFLLEDVRQLGRRYPLGLRSGLWLGLFYAGYGLIRFKSWISWAWQDLLFLVGLELTLIRTIRRD